MHTSSPPFCTENMPDDQEAHPGAQRGGAKPTLEARVRKPPTGQVWRETGKCGPPPIETRLPQDPGTLLQGGPNLIQSRGSNGARPRNFHQPLLELQGVFCRSQCAHW